MNLPALPTNMTPELIRGAILPAKFLAMEKAIAECTDPYLLKPYSDVLQAACAAARVIKHEIPVQYEKLRQIAGNAEIRLGDLLLEYSGNAVFKGNRGGKPSDRRIIASELGLSKAQTSHYTRIASAPKEVKQSFLQSDLSVSTFVTREASSIPRRRESGFNSYSQQMRDVMGRGKGLHCGLSASYRALRDISVEQITRLAPHEKTIVRGSLIEIRKKIQSLLDAL